MGWLRRKNPAKPVQCAHWLQWLMIPRCCHRLVAACGCGQSAVPRRCAARRSVFKSAVPLDSPKHRVITGI